MRICEQLRGRLVVNGMNRLNDEPLRGVVRALALLTVGVANVIPILLVELVVLDITE